MSSIKGNKTIIFFDGDGTIWYPKSTKRSKPPYWIYGDTKNKKISSHYLRHLVLTNTALKTLKKLRRQNIRLVLLSTHPHTPKIADVVLHMKLKHLKILDIFDEYCATNGSPGAKGRKIATLLKKYKLSKSRALMVGDSYHYDYLSAKSVGVYGLLLRSTYLKHPARGPKVTKMINKISDILKFI